ncbi:Polyphenol oxidase [Ralstonia condita]|jgi:YfiH family protein|uniref:Purine nucleoside phosphorylase n=1 Tax=Ralstonia condita TaxID=3058600 RepID=A0ABM9J2U2_9RALS|nr:peptidoglycan editing factor PgeF [Ralstonia sp. LMG 7141]CAJ0780627.1 Polyphenol oxidase [Ralstonia sp. LMG 7141]
MSNSRDWIIPDWPAHPRVRALSTTRLGGVSVGPYGLAGGLPGGLNLGRHVGDAPEAVEQNRRILREALPSEPVWMEQVHGTGVADLDQVAGPLTPVVADAAVASCRDRVCVVMTADCLPILLSDARGVTVGAAHAGWRGLCSGVIERTIDAMMERLRASGQEADPTWLAWLGPAIGPSCFEVGEEVRRAFLDAARPDEWRATEAAFVRGAVEGKFFADLYALARLRLARLGCTDVYGGGLCTMTDASRFYSYRRASTTGRMATLIWRAE